MSKEKTPNVPTVEAQKQENSNPVESSQTAVIPDFPKPPTLSLDLKGVNPEMLSMAEGMGIPIKGILDYVNSLQAWSNGAETRISAILANFDGAVSNQVKKSLTDILKEAQEKQQTAAPAVSNLPVAQGQPSNPIMALLSNPQIVQQMTQLFNTAASSVPTINVQDLALQSLQEDLALGKAIRNSIIQKVSSKIANDVATAIG